MNSTCQFSAPNGNQSLLHTRLTSLLGESEASRIWYVTQTDQFKAKHGKLPEDINGEPTAEAVLKILQITPPVFKPVLVTKKGLSELRTEVLANPNTIYILTAKGKLSDLYKVIAGWGATNVRFEGELQTLHEQSSSIPSLGTPEATTVDIDETVLLEQKEKMFFKHADGTFFTTAEQEAILSTAMWSVYQTVMVGRTYIIDGVEVFKTSNKVKDSVAWIFTDLTKSKKTFENIILGKRYRELADVTPDIAKQRLALIDDARNQMEKVFALLAERLEQQGIPMRGGERLEKKWFEDLNKSLEEEGKTLETEGRGLQDWSSVVFELNPADTASTRMKLMMSIIPQAEFVDGKLVDRTSVIGGKLFEDFDGIFSTALGTLAGVKPDIDTHIAALKATSLPYLHRLAEMLENSSNQIRNEFVSVMYKHNESYRVLLWAKDDDGRFTSYSVEGNRGSAVQAILEGWQELQKSSPAILRDAGGMRLNRTGLEELRNLVRAAANSKPVDLITHAPALIRRLLEFHGIHLSQAAIDHLVNKVEAYTRGTAKEGGLQRQFAVTQDNQPQGIFSALAFAGEDNEDTGIAEGNPLYENRQTLQVLAKAVLPFLDKVYSTSHGTVDGKKVWDYILHSSVTEQVARLKNIDQAVRSVPRTPTLFGQMTYAYGTDKRPGVDATTTIQAIRMGERTATTRYESDGKLDYWKKAKVGDVIEFTGSGGERVLVEVTKPLTQLGANTSAEEWSRKEGWSVEYFNSKVKPKLNGAWQIEYKYLPSTTATVTSKPSYLKALGEHYFTRYNYLVKRWLAEPGMLKGFGVGTLEGMRERDAQGDGVVRSDMSGREQWVTTLNLFANGGNLRTGSFLSLTHSDKSRTPVFYGVPKIDIFAEGAVLKHFTGLITAEVARMVAAPAGSEQFEKGRNLFYMLPELNYSFMQVLVQGGIVTQEQMNTLWEGPGQLNRSGADLAPVIKAVVNHVREREVNQLLKEWTRLGVVSDTGIMVDRRYLNKIVANPKVNLAAEGRGKGQRFFQIVQGQKVPISKTQFFREAAKVLANDYWVNSYLFNASLAQIFYGDPAEAFKGKGTDMEMVASTMIEYEKRLAKDIAPRISPAWPADSTYKVLVLEDFIDSATYIDNPAFKALDATDAQEYITVQEHLDTLYYRGQLPEALYQEMTDKIRNSGGYYEFTLPEHTAVLMDISKPVYAGKRNPLGGDMRQDYVKSAAMVLYPPMLKGHKLDELRRVMESQGIQRAAYGSAYKVGAPKKLTIFQKDGTLNIGNMTESVVTLRRENLGIQQDRPFDEEKDAIGVVTQMDRMITAGIQDMTFKLNGQDISGDALRKKKESLVEVLVESQLIDLIAKFPNEAALYDWLAQEGLRNKVAENSVAALMTRTKEGKPLLPLLMNPQGGKLTRMLLSKISANLRFKVPGASFVQASSAGITRMLFDAPSTGVHYLSGYKADGLKTARLTGSKVGEDGMSQGEVMPAEVLVPFSYLQRFYPELKLKDVLNEQGEVDPSKIPAEALRMVLARIPNQGFNSMLPATIVGFLPDQMGDTIIVPSAITRQMGSDFDVDKLYTYGSAYSQSYNYPDTATKVNRLETELGPGFRVVYNNLIDAQRDTPEGERKSDTQILKEAVQATIESVSTSSGDPYTADVVSRADAILSSPREWGATGIDGTKAILREYFDIHWAVLTAPEVYPLMMAPLDRTDLKSEVGAKAQQSFFSPVYQMFTFMSQKDAKTLVGRAALALTGNAMFEPLNLERGTMVSIPGEKEPFKEIKPIKVLAEDGNILELYRLSGQATSWYYPKDGDHKTKEPRTRAENLSILLSEILDHAKHRTIDSLNINSYTFNAFSAFIRLSDHAGESVSLKYPARLMQQPILREYVELMSLTNDTLSDEFTASAQGSVFFKLQDKFSKLAGYGSYAEYVEKQNEILFDPQFLAHMIYAEQTPQWAAQQLAALELFIDLDATGKRIAELQSYFNQLSGGVGQDILAVEDKAAKVDSLARAEFNTVIVGTTDLANTQAGYLQQAGTNTVRQLLGEEVPGYVINQVMKDLSFLTDATGMGNVSLRNQQRAYNAMVDYLYTNSASGILWNNSFNERRRLVYGQDSLAHRIQKAQLKENAKFNYFLRRLQPRFSDTGEFGPHLVGYNSGMNTQQSENTRGWIDLITSEDEELKSLGIDLVKYAMLVRPYFKEYIPTGFLDSSGVATQMRASKEAGYGSVVTPHFFRQLIQHHPQMAERVSPNLEEFGQNVPYPPEYFRVPPSREGGANTSRYRRETEKGSVHVPYISTYKNGTWFLYERLGESNNYVRIDTLGKNGVTEYSDISLARSIFPENMSSTPLMASTLDSSDNILLTPEQSAYIRATVTGREADYKHLLMQKMDYSKESWSKDDIENFAKWMVLTRTGATGLDTFPELSKAFQKHMVRPVEDLVKEMNFDMSAFPEGLLARMENVDLTYLPQNTTFKDWLETNTLPKEGVELAKTVLERVAANKAVPAYLRDTAKLMASVPAVVLGNTPFTIHVVNSHLLERGRTIGQYSGVTNTLLMSENAMNRGAAKGAETLMHEFMHYFTTAAITARDYIYYGMTRDKLKSMYANYFIGSEEAIDKVVDGIMASVDQFRKHPEVMDTVKQLHDLYLRAKSQYETERPVTVDKYGFDTFHEFTVFASTNPAMMSWLNTQVEGKGGDTTLLEKILKLFDKMLKSIAKMLGVDVNKDKALYEALTLTWKLNYQMSRMKDDSGTTPSIEPNNLIQEMLDDSQKSIDMGISSLVSVKPYARAQMGGTPLERAIGLFKDRRHDLYNSLTTLTDKAKRAARYIQIDEITDQIQQLEQLQDLKLVGQYGARQLGWVKEVLDSGTEEPNQLMHAYRIASMWSSILDLLYTDQAGQGIIPNPDIDQVSADATRYINELFVRLRTATVNQAGIPLTPKDFTADLKDEFNGTAYTLSLDRTKSRVSQEIARALTTAARFRDEEQVRLTKKLKELREEHGDNLRNLIEVTKNGISLIGEYNQSWFDFISQLGDTKSNEIDKSYKNTNIGAATAYRAAAWARYRGAVNNNAVYVDITHLFDKDTGARLNTPEADAEQARLEGLLGKPKATELISKAKDKIDRYIELRDAVVVDLQTKLTSGAITQATFDKQLYRYITRRSPFVAVSNLKGAGKAINYNEGERSLVMVPHPARTHFHDQTYATLSPESMRAYKEVKETIQRMVKMLPIHLQQGLPENFFPYVAKEFMSDALSIPEYLKTMPKRFLSDITGFEATKRDELPIRFTEKGKTDVADFSTDVPVVLEMFANMALHYKHFSAVKDYADMIKAQLEEIHKSRIAGGQPGLENMLKTVDYNFDYLMYRNPKDREMKLGKIYSANPAVHMRASARVKELLVQQYDVEEGFANGTLTVTEYTQQIGDINQELEKYEGMTMYGSRIGDKLINIAQLKALSYNPFSAIANLSFGWISAFTYGNAKRDYTIGEYLKGTWLMKSSVKKFLTAGGLTDSSSKKVFNILERMGIMGDTVDSWYGKTHLKTGERPWYKKFGPFAWLTSTDYFMKGSVTMAMLMHKKVKVSSGEISLFEALDENGNWDESKWGKRPEWSSDVVEEQTDWIKFRDRVIRVNMIVMGNQDRNSPKLLNKTIMGRLIGQFRLSWLPEGFAARFEDKRYDSRLERDIKGRYRTYGDLGFMGSLQVLGRQLMSVVSKKDPFMDVRLKDGTPMSEADMDNMRRNMAGLAFTSLLFASILLLKLGLDDEDDEESKRTTQLLLNMLIRNKQDLTFYSSPQVFDTVTRNAIPATDVITDYMKLGTATMKVLFDEDYEAEKWLLKLTKAGLPIPQATLVNKIKFMTERDIDDVMK